MASDDKLHIDQQRGVKARALLSNELLQEAFTKLEKELLDDWKSTGPQDGQRREDAWRSLKLLQNLQEQLKRVVTTGEAASKELLKIKKPHFLSKVI
jgi:hypothetical protein